MKNASPIRYRIGDAPFFRYDRGWRDYSFTMQPTFSGMMSFAPVLA